MLKVKELIEIKLKNFYFRELEATASKEIVSPCHVWLLTLDDQHLKI